MVSVTKDVVIMVKVITGMVTVVNITMVIVNTVVVNIINVTMINVTMVNLTLVKVPMVDVTMITSFSENHLDDDLVLGDLGHDYPVLDESDPF